MNEKTESLLSQKIIGVLLAVFLGNFGFHQAYLGKYRLAFVYALFFWTGIPGLIALVEAFFMPGRIKLRDQNGIEFEPLKFFGFPLGGFLSVFVVGSMINFMMGKPFLWAPPDLNKDDLSNGATPPKVKKLLGDQLSIKKSSLTDDRKTEEGIIDALDNLMSQPEQFYKSDMITDSLKESMSEKDIKFLSDLLQSRDSVDRGYINRIDGGVNTGSLKVANSYVFSLKVYKEEKTYSIKADFWKIKNNGLKLGRVMINSKEYNWSPWKTYDN